MINGNAAKCLGCEGVLGETLIDLGLSPLANSFVSPENASQRDQVYPLRVRVCNVCLLAQLDQLVPPEEIFTSDYAYFSSFSASWLSHAEAYAKMVISRFELGPESRVLEVASNDGYLLRNFVAAGIPCLGIEPSSNVAAAARKMGIPTEVAFFGASTASRLLGDDHSADLLAAKNVLAHVPDVNDFVAGVRIILKPEGVFTVEFPHLLNLIREVQFDTIYHEHFTYLSLLAIERVFVRHGLRVFDVEEISTHGGSLRVFACRQEARHHLQPGVAAVQKKEIAAALDRPEGYRGFAEHVRKVRDDLCAFLDDAKSKGLRVAAYGAAAKGNTLLNYCEIGPDKIVFVADLNPTKQNKLLPGSHIPVYDPKKIAEERPDFIVILPWNLRAEIMEQLAYARTWHCRFVVAIPHLKISS